MSILIDTLMERLHELTKENNKLKHENQEYKKTIERLGSALAHSGSAGMAEQDHGVAGEAPGICGADRVVGLLCGQTSAESVARDGHVATSTSFDVPA